MNFELSSPVLQLGIPNEIWQGIPDGFQLIEYQLATSETVITVRSLHFKLVFYISVKELMEKQNE